ncbi:MAG: ROK family transcriptional regulator [Candidatus Sumerlaeota bacterium]|nr:ROK family transcriptional regulator [Candidatus Sumerlaeota bacterium]
MANHSLLKSINRARILNAIRLHSPLSRSDLARRVSLDRKSITNLLGELLASGVVVEVGKTQADRGRPQTLLSFDTERHGVLGIAISEAGAMGAAVDWCGNMRSICEVEYPFDSGRPRVLGAMRRVYERLKAVDPRHVDAVGICVPGVIDLDRGIVERSVNLPALKGVSILDVARGFISEPLFLEDSPRARAQAEKWFGLGATERSFVCVNLGAGVGAAIVEDGRLHSRRMGAIGQGQIGHVRGEKNGRPCRCGNRGCLEAYISERVLLAEIREATGAPMGSLEEVNGISPPVRRILRAAGYRLGLVLADVINIVSPPLIVLSGRLMRFQDIVMPEVLRGARECSAPACFEGVQIVPSKLESAAVLGAAARALSEVFEVNGHSYV